jgi:hypothetical protein
VGTLAYMSLEAPPALTVPRANVIIRVPRLRHCTVHAASECGINASYLRNLERWCELAPGRVYIWEYGTNFNSFLYPFPCLTSIAANLRLYRRMGVAGVTVQGNYVTMGSDLVVLKNYVWRHVLWEPSLATEDLVREFCAGYYGPAAEAVASYVTTLEDGVRRPSLIHADEFAPPSYLTPEVRRALAERRLEALRDAGGRQPYLRRVKEATAGIEVLALDGRRPFVERPGCLTRSGAGDDAWERALDVMGHVRNSGNNEWTTGQTYWLDFLGSQGGPLVTLQRGPLRVSVAPLLGGQLRRLEWGGRNLLSASLEPPAKGFPETGGSAAVFGGGTRFMRIVGSPTDERLTMDNAFVIEGSRFLTPATHTQTVELASDREVTIALTPAAKAKPAGATVTTVYAIGGESNGCEVAVEAAGGEWQAVALAPAGSHVILTDVAGCRLGFRAAGLRVVDRYLAPDSVSLKIGADAAGRALTVVAETSPLDRRSSPAPPLLRQLTVEPVAPR